MSLPRTIATLVAMLTAVTLLASLSATSAEATPAHTAKSVATAGSSIPAVTVKVGFTPYADELLTTAGITRGYFKDVGITIDPAPYGSKVNLFSSLTPLLNRQIDIGSGGIPAIGSQLDTVKNVVGFATQDVFYGYRILAPKGKYTTFAQYRKKGKTFKQAVAAVFKEVSGGTLTLPDGTVPTFYDLFAKTAGSTMDKVKETNLANPDLVRAALAGNAQFVSPTGAQQITQLQVNGWEPLITTRDLIDNLPTKETTSLRATYSGFLTTTDYAKNNWDTLLRFTSVMYRVVDDMEKDGPGTAADFVDYLNSYSGSNLTATEIAGAFKGGSYSLRDFDKASQFYTDKRDPFYMQKTLQSFLDNLSSQGVITKGHTASQLTIAKAVYLDLVMYKKLATKQITSAPTGSLKTKAQTLFTDRDYLDAYRLAKKANG